MTTRYNALTVILEHEIREDDLEVLISAIRMLRGVSDVRPEGTDNLALEIAEMRVRRDLTEKPEMSCVVGNRYQDEW